MVNTSNKPIKKYSKGLQDVIAAQSSVCYVDGDNGRLFYRGYKIEDLAKHSSFEEVTYLLWHGRLPRKKELDDFKKKIIDNMKIRLPNDIQNLIRSKISVSKYHPCMSSLRTCISLLSAYDNEADDNSIAANERKAFRILGAMPVIIAGLQRVREGKKILSPKNDLGFAANFLYMLNGVIPTKEQARVMDVALILHADHELNASTFAARVTVATLSDIYSGMVSAIGTLKGPLHGGANVKAIENLHMLAKKLDVKDICVGKCLDDVDKYVAEMLKEHIKIMGIGHRVYKVKDPRAIILEQYAIKAGKKYIKYYQMAKEIERRMAAEKSLYPNVDFFSGIVYENLGIKTEIYVCLFALSRTSGWIAHMLEQYSDNKLIRPTQLYMGKINKKYIAINKRNK